MYFWFLLVENHTALHKLRIEVTVPVRRSSGLFFFVSWLDLIPLNSSPNSHPVVYDRTDAYFGIKAARGVSD